MLSVHAIPALKDNYIWLITSKDQQHVLIVDPGDAEPVIHHLEHYKLTPAAILITHHHYDHTDGIQDLVARYQLPVYGPASEAVALMSHPLSNVDKLTVTSHFPDFAVINIAGHTTGHIAYLTEDCLFCGDTLFGAGCGRILGGTAEQLFESLQWIASLPKQTKIFCAHEYTAANLRFAATIEPNNVAIQQRIRDTQILRQKDKPSLPSTLALELKTNPFLRCDQPEVIQAAQHFSDHAMASPIDVFKTLRAWKDKF